ncbi:unnamed protein product [Cladocopium goreaui]|uniref:Nitrate transporter n=1 Tax=Cladocopium goreaui TaxID=2562237 RepID=A0A9P1FER0_9DINO|nr:unnamed protein product [Cladocopium goreaui]
MGVRENQLYPPEDNPKRAAYLKYKSLKTGDTYCKYGKNDDVNPTDCNPVPNIFAGTADGMQYRTEVLAKCVCTTGTGCKLWHRPFLCALHSAHCWSDLG